MGFFDLNIPYYESDRHATDHSSLKRCRLRLTLKAMELGYTGVAYNRTLKGVMAETHRCSTTLFPLSKLTPSSSSFFASVEFHRRLLNIPVSSPFRQYTRLTVVVDNPSQASALNAGNPILRSYDIVAVRPTNQIAFDQACKISEVDIIAIDFAEKLQFRLKQPMVKAAIQRGLHFEVTYCGLIADPQSRRQMISNCKLLVDWTRGKNLIFSSAASSAAEFRGPQDVTNLLTLLGLPVERAKADISKNCRSLITNALRKKHFHKEAVKVEQSSVVGLGDRELSTPNEWDNWDPISSGDGDILLDDMRKSFSMFNTISKVPKTIDFSSTVNNLPVHGLQIKDLIKVNMPDEEPPGIGISDSPFMDIEGSAAVSGKPDEQDSLLENQSSLDNLSLEKREVFLQPGVRTFSDGATNQDSKALTSALLPLAEKCLNIARYDDAGFKDFEFLSFCNFANSKDPVSVTGKKLNPLNDVEVNLFLKESPLQDTRPERGGTDVLPDGEQVPINGVNPESIPIPDNHVSIELCNALNDSSFSSMQIEESNEDKRCDVSICAREVVTGNKSENEKGPLVVTVHASSQDGSMATEPHGEITDTSVGSNYALPAAELLCQTISKDVSDEPKDTSTFTSYQDVKYLAGRERRKQNRYHRHFLFRFKPLLNPRSFKRKARK